MKSITTALCSFGMSGKLFHAPFLQLHPGFDLYGVLERNKNLAQEIYPGIKTFRNLDELLADDAIELVVVNTPSITHYSFAKQAILAGKHLVVEKPFTPTVEEAMELITLAREHNVTLSVYHNRRFDSDYRTVKKVLDEGLLGNIVEAAIHFDRYNPALSAKIHKETPTPGVGTLYDLGSHIIDQALQLFGLPTAVFADISAFRPGSAVVDYFDLKLFYPAHRVSLKSSYFVREPLPGYVFHGTQGSFIKPKTNVQENDLQAGKLPAGDEWGMEPESERGLLHTEQNGSIVRKHISSLRGSYMDYYEGMLQAIRHNAPVPVTGYDAMLVIKIIETAMQSNASRKVIELA